MTTITRDMTKVADVIGELGLNIAEAQKELNAGYIDALVKLLAIAKHAIDTPDAAPGTDPAPSPDTISVLSSIAPPQYQYSQTTLEFAADMAQRSDKELSIGGSVGFGSVSLVGGYSSATGQDYRAAARITTIMQAVPSGKFAQELVNKAGEADIDFAATMKNASAADKRLAEATSALVEAFGGEVPPVEDPGAGGGEVPPAGGADAGGGGGGGNG